uniref:Uncharacterized protein n=1 Tax=Picea glauca TaxID=3330 RepID=A0A101M308_PICGL|nr:hypothetical protein ABT39_MTgene3236 [Picea glauca]QHR89266.1 hypothetical protein Q903MT_gene3286 [Picea sitchensis]
MYFILFRSIIRLLTLLITTTITRATRLMNLNSSRHNNSPSNWSAVLHPYTSIQQPLKPLLALAMCTMPLLLVVL